MFVNIVIIIYLRNYKCSACVLNIFVCGKEIFSDRFFAQKYIWDYVCTVFIKKNCRESFRTSKLATVPFAQLDRIME